MRSLKLTVFAVLFSFVAAVSAQTVDEIIAKNIQAHGGEAKLRAVNSMRLTGDFSISGTQFTFTQVYKRPMMMRLDAPIQGMTLTQAYDGQNGWQVNPFTGKGSPEPMSADDLKRVQEEADFDGPLLDYKKKGHTVELVGKEKTDGVDAYHLKVTLKDGAVRNLYIDAGSFLTTKAVGKAVVQGTEVMMESRFSDFRDVQGVKFPFSINRQAADGQVPDTMITFQKLEINVAVEDAFFKQPAPAPASAPAGGTASGPPPQ